MLCLAEPLVVNGYGKLIHDGLFFSLDPLPLAVRVYLTYTGYTTSWDVTSQMNFSHYSDKPVELAADLVNTLQRSRDDIGDPAQLDEFLNGYRDMWEGAAQAPKPAELPKIHALRDSLRGVFEAPDHATAAERINVILNDHGAVPHVSVHSGTPHLHFEPVRASFTAWLGATTAMGLATVLIEHGVERFGVCNSGDCDDVFVDSSRNRSRLHCSTTCSTREAVASYRRRQSG